MSQDEVDQEVARLTGESIRTVRKYGFSILHVGPVEGPIIKCGPPKTISWDRIERQRNTALFGATTRAGRCSS